MRSIQVFEGDGVKHHKTPCRGWVLFTLSRDGLDMMWYGENGWGETSAAVVPFATRAEASRARVEILLSGGLDPNGKLFKQRLRRMKIVKLL